MSAVFDKLTTLLNDARSAATLEKACFGFPNDRIEIKSIHFGCGCGNVGDEVHPTEYIRNMVKLHHQTWIISQIDNALAIIESHRTMIDRAEKLRKTLDTAGIEELVHAIECCRKGPT